MSELCHIPSEPPVKHRDLEGHSDAHRCCGKSLMGSSLVPVGVRQHARAEFISKRAPSTTRTSLRLWNQRLASGMTDIIAHATPSQSVLLDHACNQ